MYESSYTLQTLPGLIMATYLMAVGLAFIFHFISWIFVSGVDYAGRKKEPLLRRVWFFSVGGLPTVFVFLWNQFFIMDKIKGAPALDKFQLHVVLSTLVTLAVFISFGFVMSKIFQKTKYGTLFSKKK